MRHKAQHLKSLVRKHMKQQELLAGGAVMRELSDVKGIIRHKIDQCDTVKDLYLMLGRYHEYSVSELKNAEAPGFREPKAQQAQSIHIERALILPASVPAMLPPESHDSNEDND